MMKWWTLYLKEIKDSITLFGLMIALVFSVEVYAIFHAGEMNGMVLSLLPLFFLIAVLPMIMFYWYGREWKTDARYLLLSLPIPRFMIGLIKYLVVMSLGIVLLVISLIGIYWNYQLLPESEFWQNISLQFSHEMSQYRLSDSLLGPLNDLWGGMLALYLVALYFLLGFSVVVQSVNLIIKRFSFIVTILSGLLGWYIYFQLGGFVVSELWMPFIMETSSLSYNESFLGGASSISTSHSLSGMGWFVYTFLMGLLFLVGGLFLTEKYLET